MEASYQLHATVDLSQRRELVVAQYNASCTNVASETEEKYEKLQAENMIHGAIFELEIC